MAYQPSSHGQARTGSVQASVEQSSSSVVDLAQYPGLTESDVARAERLASAANIPVERLLTTLSRTMSGSGRPSLAASRGGTEDPELEQLVVMFFADEDYYDGDSLLEAAPAPEPFDFGAEV